MGKLLLSVVLATLTLGFALAIGDGGKSCPETKPFKQTIIANDVDRHLFGSFDTKNNWSYLVPREPEDIDVFFRIFLEPLQAPIDYRPASGASIPNALLSRNLTIICHGLPRKLAAPADTLVRVLLQQQGSYVLEILWSVGGCQDNDSADFYYCPEKTASGDNRWYQEAASDARLVARATARMLKGFVSDYEYNLTRVHFIGFGIGAHVGGFVAHELVYTRNVLGRLTVLDAASPLFEPLGLSRLSPHSARRVDAVHTGGARPCGLGMTGRLGTLDIYVNGGERQPHCKSDDAMCSHLAALGYYAQSVKCRGGAGIWPLPGYWTNTAGILKVRWSSPRCSHLVTSDPAEGTSDASGSISIAAWWTIVIISALHVLHAITVMLCES